VFRHLLIPTDGSERAQKAVRAGVALAVTLAARVTLVTVSAPYASLDIDPLPPAESDYLVLTERAAGARLRDAETYALARGVAVRSMHVYDEPWRAIVQAAQQEHCDLICMASHGRSGAVALVAGSQTRKVLTYATMPVLVIR
jgi:nucleotide-binding universal stress UspA family protein